MNVIPAPTQNAINATPVTLLNALNVQLIWDSNYSQEHAYVHQTLSIVIPVILVVKEVLVALLAPMTMEAEELWPMTAPFSLVLNATILQITSLSANCVSCVH